MINFFILNFFLCRIEETEEEIQKRLNKWDQYLEAEENKKAELEAKNDAENTETSTKSETQSTPETPPTEETSKVENLTTASVATEDI